MVHGSCVWSGGGFASGFDGTAQDAAEEDSEGSEDAEEVAGLNYARVTIAAPAR